MKLFLLLLFCAIVVIFGKTTHKATTKKIECEGVHVHGKLHRRRVLAFGLNRPYHLAVYNEEHQIFFSRNVGDDTQDTFGIAYVKNNYTEPTAVEGIKNGFALAIDEHNKRIFFGGSEGIYEGNLTNFGKLHHIVKNRDIWDLFYHKHHLYFIEYPSQHLHKYNIKENKTSKHEHITDKIYQFVIDGDNNMFMAKKDGLHELRNGTNTTKLYSGPTSFRAIEVNHKGVPNFAARKGIYVANRHNHTLTEIASIRNLFGLAFDTEDNIIYSNPHEIIKLVPHDCK